MPGVEIYLIQHTRPATCSRESLIRYDLEAEKWISRCETDRSTTRQEIVDLIDQIDFGGLSQDRRRQAVMSASAELHAIILAAEIRHCDVPMVPDCRTKSTTASRRTDTCEGPDEELSVCKVRGNIVLFTEDA